MFLQVSVMEQKQVSLQTHLERGFSPNNAMNADEEESPSAPALQQAC